MATPQPTNGELRLVDGQLGWSGGVQSDTPRTKVLTGVLEDGVDQDQLAWMINGSVRGGGIGQRPVLQPLVQDAPWSGLYQGGLLYEPDDADPRLLLLIGGRPYVVRVDTDNSVVDLAATYGAGLVMPSTITHAYFAQTEMFGVIQAGDLVTLPLFYDAGDAYGRPESFRRSNGLVNPGVSDPNNELPSARAMVNHAQRTWYAYGRGYAGSDIVANQASGSAAFDYRDSVLKLTENPVAYGGDAFIVPTAAGNIRGLAYAANLDTALGQTDLYVFTRRAVYACSAPVTRTDWTATALSNMPLQKVALVKGGSYSDRCIVPVNGDLFFQSPPNGDIRSVQASIRYFGQWGNVPLSTNINRLTQFNDRSLLHDSTGILYGNRLFESALPIVTPAGTAHQALSMLDFDVISTFQKRKPPAWEGVWDVSGGPYILQLFEGDFGGRERAFAVVWSTLRSAIEVWEIRDDLRFEDGEGRVTRQIEFPAYPFGDPFGLKELVGGELWFDKLLGDVFVEVWYRPDSYACWQKWWAFEKCAAKDCREDIDNPCSEGYPDYPKPLFCESDAIPVTFPTPVFPASVPSADGRPANLGYQFQVKLVVKGWARIRGLLLYALWRERRPYEGLQTNVAVPRL